MIYNGLWNPWTKKILLVFILISVSYTAIFLFESSKDKNENAVLPSPISASPSLGVSSSPTSQIGPEDVNQEMVQRAADLVAGLLVAGRENDAAIIANGLDDMTGCHWGFHINDLKGRPLSSKKNREYAVKWALKHGWDFVAFGHEGDFWLGVAVACP